MDRLHLKNPRARIQKAPVQGPKPNNSVCGRLGIFRGGIIWNPHFDLGRGSKKGDAIRGCHPDRREAKEIYFDADPCKGGSVPETPVTTQWHHSER